MSAKTKLNNMCPAARNINLGTFLETIRDALEEIQDASQLGSFGSFKAALDATATSLTAVTADEGTYDLDYND